MYGLGWVGMHGLNFSPFCFVRSKYSIIAAETGLVAATDTPSLPSNTISNILEPAPDVSSNASTAAGYMETIEVVESIREQATAFRQAFDNLCNGLKRTVNHMEDTSATDAHDYDVLSGLPNHLERVRDTIEAVESSLQQISL
ncbi:hypothetical protein HDU88_008010 [Geranomyces variabilis]|nr:hypothetical protein HDU88_008010 [Geranomyces variabilis]